MSFVRESVSINGRALTLETGRLAKQAHGSILVTYGETVVLVTAVSQDERPGLDFFPLTCEYVEKTYAAGKIPGGFFKREARQREEEILTCRIMDRPLRDRKSTRLNSSHANISYAVFCLKKQSQQDAESIVCSFNATLAVGERGEKV